MDSFILKIKSPAVFKGELKNNIQTYSDIHCLQTSLLTFKFCQAQNKSALF